MAGSAAGSANVIGVNPLFATERRDNWWMEPVLTVSALVLFGIYCAWAAFQPEKYSAFGSYISPFFSPNLRDAFHSLLGWWPYSPALLILWAPLAFRATCYFYRRAYYRSFFMDPPACAVGESRTHSYKGETKFPFILQNLHRYFFYIAVILVVLHWVHSVEAFRFPDGIHMNMGTFILLIDAILLTLYVFSCHSCRHLIGGRIDCFSCDKRTKANHKIWSFQTKFNNHHMFLAWASMATVGLADLYVRLLAMGYLTDWRIF